MSYVLQQKCHTYINYDVNHLANVCLLKSGKEHQLYYGIISVHLKKVHWFCLHRQSCPLPLVWVYRKHSCMPYEFFSKNPFFWQQVESWFWLCWWRNLLKFRDYSTNFLHTNATFSQTLLAKPYVKLPPRKGSLMQARLFRYLESSLPYVMQSERPYFQLRFEGFVKMA